MQPDSVSLEYTVEQLVKLCEIPSPSGYTQAVQQYLVDELTSLGYAPVRTNKGSVMCDIGGEGNGLALAAHVDTLGAMVRSIKANGRLRMTMIGGFPGNYIETENVTIHTRDGKTFSGTVQISDPSTHVNSKAGEAKRDDKGLDIVLDEKVKCKKDVEKLGIGTGDFVSFAPRTVVTKSGFIKSRHLDDKASAAILLALARWAKKPGISLPRKVWLLFTTYEEVGHGGSAGIPHGITEMISVDMGCVGDDLTADETMVSICAKDSAGPYDFDVTNALVDVARRLELQYALDIYPHYGSDVDATLRAGYDIRHGLLGPGVFASHGYERTHREGLENTLKLLAAYALQR
ncbi:MAG: M42 family metallopeptidase [Candidatus Cloacimonetes bacterium]|nr:M42 family metallopeptidase [Candidatus Cloacimonadota bacterium]